MSASGAGGAGGAGAAAASGGGGGNVKSFRARARRGSVSLKAMSTVASRLIAKSHEAKKNIRERNRKAEFSFAARDDEQWVWIRDPEKAYQPASIISENKEGTITVEVGSAREVRQVTKADLGPRIFRLEALRQHYDDMVKMEEVNEATILHNLSMRFASDMCYTNIGTILVSINPFKWMDHLYSEDVAREHMMVNAGELASPHIYAVAGAAFRGVLNEQTDQSIIISGESGAGKTEATKKCLQFFVEATQKNAADEGAARSSSAGAGGARKGKALAPEEEMQSKLLLVNPILEAFGNAKTIRNNNSSRFGRWMTVHFNSRFQICGSQIDNYLLEKSRVVFQAKDERNFHIFYLLVTGASSEQRKRLYLTSPPDYHYLAQSGVYEIERGPDDPPESEEFKEVEDCVSQLGIDPREWEDVLRIVSGVLCLGNINFTIDGDAGSRVDDASDEFAKKAAELLGCTADDMRSALVTQTIVVRNERTPTPLTVEKAADARNALAKNVYGRMFDWLVVRLNSAMASGLSHSQNIIGVLDIFGFEIFKTNSFEQLCINFCNEKLQQHFNNHVFKEEEKCYKSEEIDYTEVVFEDNQDVLDLIEKRPDGVLPLLDDEIRVPRGSDAGFLKKVNDAHTGNVRYKAYTRRDKNMTDTSFGVYHYAGLVVYDSNSFLDKNKDVMLLNLVELCESSDLDLMHTLFPRVPAGADAGRARKKPSQGGQFKTQLEHLMRTLNSTEPHYVRCVKPNEQKRANLFDPNNCLLQLRYAGVFEAVKIRQQGFPFRWTHEVFFKRYRGCGAGRDAFSRRIPSGANFKDMCQKLLRTLAADHPPLDECKFGRTMVLYRAEPHRILEQLRSAARATACLLGQRIFRGHVGRKYFAHMLALRTRIRAALASRVLEEVVAAAEAASRESFRLRDVDALEQLKVRLLKEKECRESLAEIVTLDPVDNFEAYKEILETAASLDFTPESEPLVAEATRKFQSVRDRIETKRKLKEGVEMGNKDLIIEALAKAEELKKEWGMVVSEDQIQEAHSTLEVIKKEEGVLDALRAALAMGSVQGVAGAVDATGVRIDHLEGALASCASATIRTKLGQSLVAFAKVIRDMRLAFRDKNMAGVELAVDVGRRLLAEAAAAEVSSPLPPDVQSEFNLAEDEVEDQHIRMALLRGLEDGCLTGRIGDLQLSSVNCRQLGTAVSRAEAARQLSDPAKTLLFSAGIIVRIRQGILDSDWSVVRKAVKEAFEADMVEQAMPEVRLAKGELDNHVIIRQLTDALSRGGAKGDVGALELTEVDTNTLKERITMSEELGPKTMLAETLLKAAVIIRQLRLAMMDGRWSELGGLARELGALPAAQLPEQTRNEMVLARHEHENIVIVTELSKAVESGCVSGQPGAIDREAVQTAHLTAAIKQANRLTCRTEQARWIYEVAEAVCSLRKTVLDGNFERLQKSILTVRAMDKSQVEGLAPASQTRARGGRRRRPSNVDMIAGVGISALRRTSVEGPGARKAAASASGRRTSATSAESEAPVEFFLSDTTRRELQLVQDHLDNHLMIKELTEVLSTPGPSGPVGQLSLEAVSTDEMAICVQKAEHTVPKTAEADQLLDTVKIVRDLRDCLLNSDWDTTELVLARVASSEARAKERDPTGRTSFLAAPARAEVDRVKREADYRRVLRDLIESLSRGMVTGVPGALNMSTLEIDALGKAIQQASSLGTPTERSKHLLAVARLVWQIRTALKSKDWDTVESLLEVSTDIIGTTAPLPPGCKVPKPSLDELALLRDQVDNRKVVQALSSAIQTGIPLGEVGHLNLALIDVKSLDSAMSFSMELGLKTKEAQRLLASCSLVRALRLALTEGRWDMLGALLEHAHSDAELGRVADDEAPSLDGVWANGYDVKVTGLSPLAEKEVKIMSDELKNRNVIVQLSAALSTGRATGEVGHLDVSSVDVSALDWAIGYAKRVGCQTVAATQMVATAQLVRRMRAALLSSNWTMLEKVLREAQGKVLADIVAPEVRAVQDELDNRLIISELTAAISSGAAKGPVGKLFVGSIDIKGLNDAITMAGRVVPKTQEAKQILFTAKAVKRLRQALMAGDYPEAKVTLEAIRGKRLATVASAEVRTIQDDVDNWVVVSDLKSALSTGGPGGVTGRLDLSQLEIDSLSRAIKQADELGCKTTEARELVVSAKQVKKLRTALAAESWEAVRTVLGESSELVITECAMPELAMAQDELDNQQIVAQLVAALDTGMATGAVGDLDLSPVEVAALDRGIAFALETGAKTADAKRLLVSAKLIRRLRSVILSGNWEWVGQVLADARNMKDCLPTASLKELQLAQDELDNRSVLSQLTAALSSGAASGPIGGLNLETVDVESLEAAIHYAHAIGCKTVESSQMVATAQLVRRLRQALLANDLGAARQMLESVKGKVLAAVAADEIQAIKYEVDNWLVISELTSALGEGAAKGSLGHLDASTVDVAALDVAIALTMRLGCHTADARRCLLTALIIRRLRAALQEDDWDFLKQVLEEAKAERESIIVVSRQELQAAKDEVEFRAVMDLLRTAVDSQDENSLMSALARATRLKLSSHEDPTVREAIDTATLSLGRIQRCKAMLESSMEAMDAPQLVDAVAMAAGLGYHTPLVERARSLLVKVQDITKRANVALETVDREGLEAALRDCSSLSLKLPILEEMKAILALDADKFLRRQLAAAVSSGDEHRVVDLTMKIKDKFFAESGQQEFQLHKFPGLKPAHMFSRKFGIADSGLQSTMLRFQPEPIHTSLTRIQDTSLRRVAVRMFRNIMAFMGDRPIAKPVVLAQEVVRECLRYEELRDEVFFQIAKQLRDNPSSTSMDRGWVLMRVCLSSFPPSEDAENYLEHFLRSRGARPCVRALHLSLFRGAVREAPDVAAIEAALDQARVPLPDSSGPRGAYTVPHLMAAAPAPASGLGGPGRDRGAPLASSSTPSVVDSRPPPPPPASRSALHSLTSGAAAALMSAPPDLSSPLGPSGGKGNGLSAEGAPVSTGSRVVRPPGPPPPGARVGRPHHDAALPASSPMVLGPSSRAHAPSSAPAPVATLASTSLSTSTSSSSSAKASATNGHRAHVEDALARIAAFDQDI